MITKALFLGVLSLLVAERPSSITIDGTFTDWDSVRKYRDPHDNIDGSVLQDGIPDCHNTTESGRCSKPTHVFNPIVDILEYALAHDSGHLYAYFKSAGNITLTSTDGGREYIGVNLDVDDDIETGYCVSGGGYFPDSCGYDLLFELEIFNGSFNSAYIILHSMTNNADYQRAHMEQRRRVVSLAPAIYDIYTEWVYWDDRNPITPEEGQRCTDGPYYLPGNDHPVICFVQDKCNCRFQGVMKFAVSKDFHEIEISAPFEAFMNYANGKPTVALGKRMTVEFFLETSEQFSTPRAWASDGTWPIRGYVLEP